MADVDQFDLEYEHRDGRVVVRSSGTEPLVRVMVEAPTVQSCDRWCRDISIAVERELGGRVP